MKAALVRMPFFSDALFIFDHISKKYHIPSEKIILKGRSLGSAVAIHVAGQRKVKAVLLVTPFDNMVNVAKKHYPIFPHQTPAQTSILF